MLRPNFILLFFTLLKRFRILLAKGIHNLEDETSESRKTEYLY